MAVYGGLIQRFNFVPIPASTPLGVEVASERNRANSESRFCVAAKLLSSNSYAQQFILILPALRSPGGREVLFEFVLRLSLMSNACIVRGEIPADEFALYEALSSLPGVEFEIEHIVLSSDKATVPLIWVRKSKQEAVETAIENDHSVQDFMLLSAFDDELLYRMEWISEVELVLQMLTNSKATITDAFGTDGQWYLRILYPNRESLAETTQYAEKQGLTFDLTAIRRLEDKPASRLGLTEAQFEALETAHETGFYDIPRGIDQNELANELNISHQALSERLRRATDALIEDVLLHGKAAKRDDSE